MTNLEADLRHMVSNTHLSSPRSGHRQTQHRRGSRSPTSIPSSPTSVRSSSSAIFERDIEPLVPPSPLLAHHPPNPHRIPRAKGTEQLEQSVPSVLDSAAAILTTLEDSENVDRVAVVAPAPPPAPLESIAVRSTSSGIASPIGSFRSRSPSPLGLRITSAPASFTRPDLPLGITSTNAQPGPTNPSLSVVTPTSTPVAASIRPTIQTKPPTAITPPAIVTPTSGYFSMSSSSVNGQSSPTAVTCELSSRSAPSPSGAPAFVPIHPSTSASPALPASASTQIASTTPHVTTIASPVSNLTSPASWTSTLSHPPSPTHGPTKRLSFMSYSDLLSSTPTSTLPLSSLTTSASLNEPPPHIPSISGLNVASAAQAQGVQSGAAGGVKANGSTTASLHGVLLGPTGGITHAGKRDSIAMLDDIGGEWEREGLGKGLEARLEALISPAALSPVEIMSKT